MCMALKAAATLWAAWLSAVACQPTACAEDSQCSAGFYCEERARYCRECLRCDELRREPPAPPVACVKSLVQCGPCLEGLEDPRLDSGCVPVAPPAAEGLPAYLWAVIGLAVVLVLVLIALLVFVIFKKGNIIHIHKIRSIVSARAEVPPSAPSMCMEDTASGPPAYEDVCREERAASPPAEDFAGARADAYDEAGRPLMKHARGAGAGGAGAGRREAAARQAAQPFNNPAYVRGPPSVIQSEESEPGSPFPPYDEETMESPWTPSEPLNNLPLPPSNGAAEAGAAEAGGSAARARRGSQDGGPPRKALCLRAEEPSESEPQEARAEGGERARGAGAFTVVINNVINNVSAPRL